MPDLPVTGRKGNPLIHFDRGDPLKVKEIELGHVIAKAPLIADMESSGRGYFFVNGVRNPELNIIVLIDIAPKGYRDEGAKNLN